MNAIYSSLNGIVMMCHASVWTPVVHVNLLRLGVLACYSSATPDLPPDLSKVFLSQLDQCDNPIVNKVQRLGVSYLHLPVFSPPQVS